MIYIYRVMIVVFLAISLVAWSSPSEARRGHRDSGYGRHYGDNHRSRGFYAFYGSHYSRRGHHFPPHHFRDYGHSHHREYYHGYGRNSHISIVLYFQNALEYARTDETTTWRNPDTGGSETITPYNTYQTSEGRYCREFVKTVTIAGEQHEAYGTACRQPDGSWEIVGQ